MPLQLASPAFAQDAKIPKKYTCEGDNLSPPLRWNGVPAGTRSFIVLCNDPDAPSGLFRHWAAYDIPADRTELAEGYGPESLEAGFRQAINDFGKPGYGGPCPPPGRGPRNYHFRLAALSEAALPITSLATCLEAYTVAQPYIIEEVELIGTYER